jgi:hypothetical protein
VPTIISARHHSPPGPVHGRGAPSPPTHPTGQTSLPLRPAAREDHAMTAMTEPRRRQISSYELWALRARWQVAQSRWRAVQARQAAHAAQHRARMARLRRHMPEANHLTLDITAAILTARDLLGSRPRPGPVPPSGPRSCAPTRPPCAPGRGPSAVQRNGSSRHGPRAMASRRTRGAEGRGRLTPRALARHAGVVTRRQTSARSGTPHEAPGPGARRPAGRERVMRVSGSAHPLVDACAG